MQHNKQFSRMSAWLLAFALIVSALIPLWMSTPVQAESATYVQSSDPSTLQGWKTLFGSESTDSSYSGAVWTDKSVFNTSEELDAALDAPSHINDAEGSFVVSLSAMASNKSIVGYTHLPTDTMLILDVSGSMANSNSVDELAEAANMAINTLQQTSIMNRIGVVLYSGNTSLGDSNLSHATLLLPLDRYTSPDDVYLVASGSRLSVGNNVKNSAGRTMSGNKNAAGGTYLQSGLYKAMEEMLKANPVVESGPQRGMTRIPIMVLMSDGMPTAGTTNFANVQTSNMGNGSEQSDYLSEIAFVSQLTAAYARARVDAHYEGTTPLFYTLGLGIKEDNTYSRSVLNPVNSTSTLNTYWNALIARGSLTLKGTRSVTLDSGYVEGLGNVVNSRDQQYYVTKPYTAEDSAGLYSVFQDIVEEILLQSRYVPTNVDGSHDFDGYISFVDQIGDYMRVTDIFGMYLGDHLFSGHTFASHFASDETALEFFGTKENPSGTGDEFIFSVAERLNITNEQARTLAGLAYQYGQLYYNNDDDFGNSITWLSDADGNYLGFYDEDYDVPVPDNAAYLQQSFGYLDDTQVTGSTAESNLLYCTVRIQTEIFPDGDGGFTRGNEVLLWRIPASLIPVVTHAFELENDTMEDPGKIEMSTNADTTHPIRLFYEVSLDPAINADNVDTIVDASHRQTDGSYVFYTNAWDATTLSTNSVNTHVDFRPSAENERFHYTADSPLYVKDSNGSYSIYRGSAKPEAVGEFYVAFHTFDWSDPNDVKLVMQYLPVSAETLPEAKYDETNRDWYIPAGMHRNTLRATGNKTNNVTETLPTFYMTSAAEDNASEHHLYSILGNNGRLVFSPSQGLCISKNVTVHTPGEDPTFTYTVTRTDAANDNSSYRGIFTSADGITAQRTVTFYNSVATITLKDDESLSILDLPTGAAYSIVEQAYAGYQLSGITVNGATLGAVTQDTAANVTVNEHNVEDIRFTNTKETHGALVIRKTVEHPFDASYTVPTDLLFTFEVALGADYANKNIGVLISGTAGEQVYTSDAEGKFTLQLAHGQSALIDDIKKDTVVTVTETDLAAHRGFSADQTQQTVTIPEDDAVITAFTNRYTPEQLYPVNLTLTGEKELIGRPWQAGDSFTFVLEAQHMQDGEPVWETLGTATTTYDPANANFAQFDFNSLIQAEVYDKIGVYSYRLREEVGSINGITYDPVISYFDVYITDADMDGEMEIANVVGFNDVTVNLPSAMDGIFHVDTRFSNSYAAKGNAALDIRIGKTMEDNSGTGRNAEGFTFAVYTEDGVMIKASDPTSAAGETSIRLVYDDTDIGKTYTYILREVDSGIHGVGYDTTAYTLHVSIKDNLDGTLRVEVMDASGASIADVNGSLSEITKTFRNTYDPSDVTFTFRGDKDLTGRAMTAGEFSFELYQTQADFAVADDAAPLQTVTNSDDAGSFAFDAITKSQVGTYYYVVCENSDAALGGVTYDNTRYLITVTVTDVNGTLEETVVITDEQGHDAALQFINRYTAQGTSYGIEGTKVLTGRALQEGEFSFSLYNTDSSYRVDGAALQTVTNGADGAFRFADIALDAEGEYFFTVEENIAATPDIDYDNSVYQLKITVIDDGEGHLQVESAQILCSGAAKDAIVFTNVYTEPTPPPTQKPTIPETGERAYLLKWTGISLLFTAGVLALVRLVKNKKTVSEEEE